MTMVILCIFSRPFDQFFVSDFLFHISPQQRRIPLQLIRSLVSCSTSAELVINSDDLLAADSDGAAVDADVHSYQGHFRFDDEDERDAMVGHTQTQIEQLSKQPIIVCKLVP
jgi:hypothetical protein